MAIRIVRLGSPRTAGEGIRIGTVRRPPRGIPKLEYARRDFYDVWLPNLSPRQELMKEAKTANDETSLTLFKKKFRSQVHEGETGKILDLLAALSHQNHFSLGCYCEDENHCHRSVLKELLAERGAKLV